MGLKLPCIEFRGKRLDSYVSFLILFTGLFLSVAMPLLIPRDPGPDAMTLWSSYARADNCKRAQSAKTTLDSGMRMARVNDKGEREILDDQQRAAELQRTNQAIAENCK